MCSKRSKDSTGGIQPFSFDVTEFIVYNTVGASYIDESESILYNYNCVKRTSIMQTYFIFVYKSFRNTPKIKTHHFIHSMRNTTTKQ